MAIIEEKPQHRSSGVPNVIKRVHEQVEKRTRPRCIKEIKEKFLIVLGFPRLRGGRFELYYLCHGL